MSAESAHLERSRLSIAQRQRRAARPWQWVNPLMDTGERMGVLTDVWRGAPYLASVT